MTRENIFIGSSANDGTGDTLRTAGSKINSNFAEIYAHLGGGDSSNLSTQVTLNDSSVVFEGSSANAFETRLKVTDPTKDNIVTIPDSTGEVLLDKAAQTVSRKTLERVSFTGSNISANGTADSNASFIIGNKATALSVSLHNGSVHGEIKYFANRKAGDMTVTPNSFALGTSFKIKQNGAIQCIWDSGEPGSVNSGKWYLLGFDSSGTTGATDFISINV